MMSSMEWTVLGDVQRLEADLPEALLLDQLEPEITSGVAAKVKEAATTEMTGGPTKEYLIAAYRALYAAAAIRNDVLHARPATHPSGSQRLLRAETTNRQTIGVRFWIDDEWFDEAIFKLNNPLSVINDRLATPQLTHKYANPSRRPFGDSTSRSVSEHGPICLSRWAHGTSSNPDSRIAVSATGGARFMFQDFNAGWIPSRNDQSWACN